jgi:hypothetical protein
MEDAGVCQFDLMMSITITKYYSIIMVSVIEIYMLAGPSDPFLKKMQRIFFNLE